MASEAKPGGKRSIDTSITVRLITEGAKEAKLQIGGFKDAVSALMGLNTGLTNAAPVEVLASSATLAAKALGQTTAGQEGVIEILKSRMAQGKKLSKMESNQMNRQLAELAKLQKAMLKNPDIFDAKQTASLIEQTAELTNLKDAIEDGNEAREETKDLQESLGKAWGGIKGGAAAALGGIVDGFKVLGSELDGKTLSAINAIGSGFKLMGKARKTVSMVAKTMSNFGNNTKDASFSVGGFFKGMQKGAGALKNFGPMLMSGVSGALALGPALLVIIPVLIVLAVALAAVIVVVGTLVVAFQLAMAGMKEVIELQEAYRHSALRAAGSISELTKTTAKLGAETRLGNGAIKDAAIAMVNAGLSGASMAAGIKDANGQLIKGQAALGAASKFVARFVHITGIGAKETAEFTKSLLALGYSMSDVQAAGGSMLIVQKKLGMTQGDMVAVMGKVTKMQSSFALTMTKTNVPAFTKQLSVMYAKARQAGVGIEGVTKLVGMLSSGLSDNAMILASFAGGIDTFMNSKDAGARLKVLESGVKEFYAQYKDYPTGQFQEIAKDMGITEDQIASVRYELKEMTKDQAEAYEKKGAIEALNEGFKEASGTLTQVLKQIFLPLMSKMTEAVGPFVEELGTMGEFVQREITPLWNELKSLVEELFGMKFADSGTLKETVKSIITGAAKLVKWVKGIVISVKEWFTSMGGIEGVIGKIGDAMLVMTLGPVGLLLIAVRDIGTSIRDWFRGDDFGKLKTKLGNRGDHDKRVAMFKELENVREMAHNKEMERKKKESGETEKASADEIAMHTAVATSKYDTSVYGQGLRDALEAAGNDTSEMGMFKGLGSGASDAELAPTKVMGEVAGTVGELTAVMGPALIEEIKKDLGVQPEEGQTDEISTVKYTNGAKTSNGDQCCQELVEHAKAQVDLTKKLVEATLPFFKVSEEAQGVMGTLMETYSLGNVTPRKSRGATRRL